MENVIKVDYYTGISLEEYKGIFALAAWNAGQDETWFQKWVFLSVFRNGKPTPGETKRPMAVRLGDKPKAIEIMEQILAKLKEGES